MPAELKSNFSFLKPHDQQLVRLGRLAERYFPEDPNTSLLKLRQLAEVLAQLTAARVGIYQSAEEGQYELINRLRNQGILTPEVTQLFGEVRRAGNAANHALSGDHRAALACMRITWQLGLWYHRTFANREYKSGPFIPPSAPKDETADLAKELAALKNKVSDVEAIYSEKSEELNATRAKLQLAQQDQAFWEQMATEAEQAKAARAAKLAGQQQVAAAQPASTAAKFITASTQASQAVELDEADTRVIIDDQLREAGWDVNSTELTFPAGTRPEKGKNRAIAEWPTASGPADYVLFVGLMPVAAVEAKRKNIDVSGAVAQAKRYSRDFQMDKAMLSPGGPWAELHLPFIFSSNARPYLKQLTTKSGTWFCDLRRSTNHGHALDGWYTPEGLTSLLKRDEAKADAGLKAEPFKYGFPLRPYQQAAIQAVEAGVAVRSRPGVVDPRYLFAWIRGPEVQGTIEDLASGSTNQIELNRTTIQSMRVPVAPVNEQKRIADKLGNVLAKVDACRERLDRLPQILKKFREAVLEAAVSGRLTEEWRGDASAEYQSVAVAEPYHHSVRGPMSWTRTNLAGMCEFVGGSQPPKSTFTFDDGPDVIRLIQIRDYKSDRHKTFIPRNLARRFCNSEDVMIGRYGPPIFQILRGLEGAYNVALMKAVPRDDLVSRNYLFYLLKGAHLLRFVEAGSNRTAGQDGVRKEQLETYPAFMPPVSEQAEIVRRIDALFGFADSLQRRYEDTIARVEKLTPSILAKAFRGELVPQDPNDEPAGEMLERMRAGGISEEAGSRKIRVFGGKVR